MPKDESFDITTGCDLQEVDNALNQARKEIAGRYDFKGVVVEIEYDRSAGTIGIHTGDQFRLDSIWEALSGRLVARKVPLKNLKRGDPETAASDTVRQTITLVQAIDSETAKKISKDVRDQGFKKVQVQIQGEELRVTSPSKDTLQDVMTYLSAQDFGVELKFGNYR